MNALREAISQTLHSNQLAAGGVLLMSLGSILASLRKVPLLAWKWIVGQTTIRVTVLDNRDAFNWFKWWFYEREYSTRSRNVDVDHQREEWKLNPGVGRHWFWHRRRPIVIVFDRESSKESYSKERKESVVLKTLGRDQNFLRELVTEMKASYEARNGQKAMLYTWDRGGDYWRLRDGFTPRPLDTVVLPADMKSEIVNDVARFMKESGFYEQAGIPYHRGYLLYGPPGTGKTTFVMALARHFNLPLYYLRLTEMSDPSLFNAMRNITRRHPMIVMEDVDGIKATAERSTGAENTPTDSLGFQVTLSGLLNALDGVHSPIGAMYFMTTNHIEKLDPALIRPGRIDMRSYLGTATPEQLNEMYYRFFPKGDAKAFLRTHDVESVTMAAFQEMLLRERNLQLA